jgi:hypothetical protein
MHLTTAHGTLGQYIHFATYHSPNLDRFTRASAARIYYSSGHRTSGQTGVSLGSWVLNRVDPILFFLLAEQTSPLLEMSTDIRTDKVDLKPSSLKFMTFMPSVLFCSRLVRARTQSIQPSAVIDSIPRIMGACFDGRGELLRQFKRSESCAIAAEEACGIATAVTGWREIQGGSRELSHGKFQGTNDTREDLKLQQAFRSQVVDVLEAAAENV